MLSGALKPKVPPILGTSCVTCVPEGTNSGGTVSISHFIFQTPGLRVGHHPAVGEIHGEGAMTFCACLQFGNHNES